MPERALRSFAARAALDDVDDPVVVACSGGADSLALLALVRARGIEAIATYVDHGLRPGAATAHDARVVTDAAARFGARVEVVPVDIGHGANLEARARDERYAALERVRAEHGATAVLVAHTADDQAETVLLNFLRGSGSDGLAGMPAARGHVRRPLLGLRRAETHEVCARLGLAPAPDAMNDDTRHRRVWLRREVLPRLNAGVARDLVPVLVRQAAVLRAESELLDEAVAGVATPGEPLEAVAVAALPRALARRAVRRWLGPPPASAADVDAVLAVVDGAARATELPGGTRVERVANTIVLCTGAADAPPAPLTVAFPGQITTRAISFESWVEEAPPTAWPSGRTTCVVDADAVGTGAQLRAALPGERFRPLGGAGSKTVFDALAEAGVPASRRSTRLVLAAGDDSHVPAGTPWWVLGYRIDDRVRVTSRTRRFLWIAASGSTG